MHTSGSSVVCWDVQRKLVKHHDATGKTYFLLQPAAHLGLGGGLSVELYRRSWAQIQATAEGDSVNIAIRASKYKAAGTR